MTPKRDYLGLGRLLRLERFEPRQMLSATPVETPVEPTIQPPSVLLTDPLIASSGYADAWTPISDDSSLSFIDSLDTTIGFSNAVPSTATPRFSSEDSFTDSIGDTDGLFLDFTPQGQVGDQPSTEIRFTDVIEILVEQTTPEATPTVTPAAPIVPDPISTPVLEPTVTPVPIPAPVIAPESTVTVPISTVTVPTTQPEPQAEPERLPELAPMAEQPEWRPEPGSESQTKVEVLPPEPETIPEVAHNPSASVAKAPGNTVAEPAEDPVIDALTQSIIVEVAKEAELAIETPETELVNDASFVPVEDRPKQDEATADPFEAQDQPRQAPVIDRQLERLAEEAAPPAGAKQPGAGLVDLTALLLEATPPQQTAQAAPPQQPETQAREAALAVESWARPLTPAGMMPATTSPPTRDVQAQRPSTGLVPLEGPTGPTESEKPLIRSVSTADPPKERANPPVRRAGPLHFAAVVISTLLGGSIVWTTQRREPAPIPDSYGRPRRERE